MHYHKAAAAGALSLLSFVTAQNATATTFSNPAVPTGTPVPGNYTGPLRPQIHFSPPQHFMNDPNGMFLDANGTWHLYYQYDPTGNVAGNQHWGHATSQDLYHWENQQIALFPPEETTYVFSGSAVIDVNNTSGFFPGQDNGVVAIFTLAKYPGGVAGPQTQNIAWSKDGGFTFQYYINNPVINSTSSQFRDPKVIFYKDHWVMVVSYAQEFTIGIFTSPDLKNWTHSSNFTHVGLLGTQYECPNLVEMPLTGDPSGNSTIYVLQISLQPGAPLGGSISQYFPGTFDGYTFTAVDAAARIADFGKDNYAGQFFYGVPSGADAVSIAWAANWQYAQQVPTGNTENFRSVMSVPRRNTIVANATRVGYLLTSMPYDLTPVLGPTLAKNASFANATVALDYSGVSSGALYFEANVTNLNASLIQSYTTLNFTFMSPQTGEYLQGGFYFGGDTPFFINRGGIRGFDNVFFTDKFSIADIYDGVTWTLSGVIDRSILEVFVDSGRHAATTTFYPTQPLSIMTLSTYMMPVGANVSVAVYALKSAWAQYENATGTVVGNITTSGNATRATMMKREPLYEASF